MKKIVNSLFVLVFGLGLVSGGIVNVRAEVVDSKSTDTSIKFTPDESPLRLDSVTNNIKFNDQGNTFNSITTKSSDPVVLELTDNRGYNPAAGWELKAELSSFSEAEDEGVTLPGSSISFSKDSLIGEFDEPNVEDTFTLVSGGEGEGQVKVATAQRSTENPNQGVGPWTFKWNGITLNVPAGSSSAGTHTATITWSLTDTPR